MERDSVLHNLWINSRHVLIRPSKGIMNLSRSLLQGGEPLSPEVYSARAPQDVHEQLQARLVVDTPAQNL